MGQNLAFFRKVAFSVAFVTAVGLFGAERAPVHTVPSLGPPCVWEEERDNNLTASNLRGRFNYYSEAVQPGVWFWEYKIQPANSSDLKRKLNEQGYEPFFDPFHDGANYKKRINGRWYHYIVHDNGRIESHWDKSEPGSLAHMLDFWRSWNRPSSAECKMRQNVFKGIPGLK